MAQKEVNVQYITIREMVADPFTKPIPKEAYFIWAYVDIEVYLGSCSRIFLLYNNFIIIIISRYLWNIHECIS